MVNAIELSLEINESKDRIIELKKQRKQLKDMIEIEEKILISKKEQKKILQNSNVPKTKKIKKTKQPKQTMFYASELTFDLATKLLGSHICAISYEKVNNGGDRYFEEASYREDIKKTSIKENGDFYTKKRGANNNDCKYLYLIDIAENHQFKNILFENVKSIEVLNG